MNKRIAVALTVLLSTAALGAGTNSVPTVGRAPPAIAVMASAAAEVGAGPLTPEEQRQLLQEVRSLRERVTALEGRPAVVQAAPPPPAAAPAPRSAFAAENNLELYGFLQLDAIQDFNRVNPKWDATLRPSRIPTTKGQFGDNGQSIFSVRQSRLGAKATGELAGKPYEAKFEFDLFGVGSDEG